MSEFKVELTTFDGLTPEERAGTSNNGCGSEWAEYIRVSHAGHTLFLESDAMDPEDCRFSRDLCWIVTAIQKAYELGCARRCLAEGCDQDASSFCVAHRGWPVKPSGDRFPQWRSVTDPPMKSGDYWIWDPGHCAAPEWVGHWEYRADLGRWGSLGDYAPGEGSFWMPLPPPPQGEKP